MKVAIVHDWLVVNAGAEKVLKEIISLYPNADIYSIVDFLEDRSVVFNKKVHTSFIQNLPFSKKYFRNYLFLFPFAIERFNLSKYDLVISSSWAFAKGVKAKFHISYCHTPIRYAWDMYDEYTKNLPLLKKILVKQTLKYIRKWDLKTVSRVDYFIANSNFVKDRIKRIYNRDAYVIYPPVDLEKFKFYPKKEDFYLVVSRLVPYKRIDLIIKAFNQMPDKKLVIIGDGIEFNNLRQIANSNIIFLGYQEDSVVVNFMQRAKAFVYAAIEDFGIAPVESLACGTPVIALNKGGTSESVIDKVNGIHFENQNEESIIEAVKKFEKLKFDYKKVSLTALRFANFKEKFKRFVEDKWEKR